MSRAVPIESPGLDSYAPSGLVPPAANPRLTPWAAFLRRSAAIYPRQLAVGGSVRRINADHYRFT
jgi:hypothetical protein